MCTQTYLNPNFPENLDIGPSSSPVRSSGLTGESRRVELSSVLDASSQKEAIEKYGIAGRVWEAAYVLLLYLERPPDLVFDPPFITQHESSRPLTFLELGSGTGIVGMKIAHILPESDGNLVILTDLPDVCDLLQENVKKEFPVQNYSGSDAARGSIIVRPLAWGASEHCLRIAAELGLLAPAEGQPLDLRYLTHIVCSDLVYFPDLLAPLLRTLIELSSPPFIPATSQNDLEVIISYKIRSLSKEMPFWMAFGLWFNFHPVLVQPKGAPPNAWRCLGSSSEDRSFVFLARRRPESFNWTVPESDNELLGGVGAWNTDTRKSDDTFETLLLMGMHEEEDETF